ncbi:hypothetical protein K491DRAFT_694124 [Lophiostoma macrostomum CBS 122681]|uniref:Uncharacterized protein n=1 Tax=Lophiostoma macrostomum CBS 122681 TaxID=1314788 RepID=A0A6A6T2X7_9PLEO|nr:hypothetical protein K491DRAFT_694124 [Lophiostoma macrostomum CBS 122681]
MPQHNNIRLVSDALMVISLMIITASPSMPALFFIGLLGIYVLVIKSLDCVIDLLLDFMVSAVRATSECQCPSLVNVASNTMSKVLTISQIS